MDAIFSEKFGRNTAQSVVKNSPQGLFDPYYGY